MLSVDVVTSTQANYTGLDVSWSPDQAFFAVAGTTLSVYSFDSTSTVISQTIGLRSVDWAPGGDMIAAGGTAGQINLYFFDRIAYRLTLMQTIIEVATNVEAVAWSPDGSYLAVSIRSSTNPTFIYRYNPVSQRLTRTQLYPFANLLAGATGVSWSPDGQYIAFTGNNRIEVALFDKGLGTASLVALVTPTGTGGKSAWSPNGNYIGVIGNDATGNTKIYQFDGASLTLKNTQDPTTGSTNDMSFAWSSDTRYATTTNSAGDYSKLYSFDKGSGQLTLLNTLSYTGLFSGGTVNGCDWSPDGGYIAVTGVGTGSFPAVYVLNAIQFPTNNTIMNNKVYCNSGGIYMSGTGISGSSISNVIIGNTCFNNSFNYQFVCNAFNQNFGLGPSGLQNIQVDFNVPILTPMDIPASIKRTELLLFSLVDNLL